MLPEILTITELNRLARSALEQRFPLLWVTGEISNLIRAASGHFYFSLKDENAQVRCAMFRARAQALPWRVENGQQVEARALVTLYEARGDFQLNVETLRRAGLGRLYEAFLQLREKLSREGLFDDARKRDLPRFPRVVGIVTSPRAAALRDVFAAFARRAPHVPLIVYPTLVQGSDAAGQIAAALSAAGGRNECDLLLLVRGGGSLEDLWSFNEEAVARAIAACPLPVVSGVGHETDVTIADLAADRRAATPTAAAELASAGWFAVARETAGIGATLRAALRSKLEKRMQALDLLARRLVHPAQRLAGARQQLGHLATRLTAACERRLQRQSGRLERLAAGISALNPQAVLARGYAIARDARGRVVRDSRQIATDETLSLRFAKGGGEAVVTRTFPD
ncbi:MAG: exodeoxyribonuclease VII large subunit [Candidatus Nitricoxidivorans perseverans]|uniref:Exodeoxyribonuclease 7 large subunit n=1 Tax=Candidatus Nitricoxidivorans perseverans TaxID=2975601 RepID=A0AA49FNH4_9PROT|nr:MAG: exodeoxyribonuclease VII large subunit [Candidatus Nitricoxidivorans perseverans]